MSRYFAPPTSLETAGSRKLYRDDALHRGTTRTSWGRPVHEGLVHDDVVRRGGRRRQQRVEEQHVAPQRRRGVLRARLAGSGLRVSFYMDKKMRWQSRSV